MAFIEKNPNTSSRSRLRQWWWFGFDPVGVFLLVIITLPLSVLIVFLKSLILCGSESDCRIWGDYILNLTLILVTSSLLVGYLIWRWERLWLWKQNKSYSVNKFIATLLTAIFFSGIFLSFTNYVKTTNNFLMIGDFIHTLSLQPINIKWSDITQVGTISGSYNTKTNGYDMVPYVILIDKSKIYLYGAINDQNLVNYFSTIKKCTKEEGCSFSPNSSIEKIKVPIQLFNANPTPSQF